MPRENLEGWIVESMRFHGTNMVSCKLISGNQQTPIIGEYLPLPTLYHLPDLEEAQNRFQARDPVVLGYLKADISRLRNPRNQQVAYFLESFGLVDLLDHFQQRLLYCNLHVWWQVRQGQTLRSCSD